MEQPPEQETAPAPIRGPHKIPDIHTEEELIVEIESIQQAVAAAIQKRKEDGYSYGPEVVAALAASIEHILAASGIDPQSILRMGVLITRKEIWETCHEQYRLKSKEEDDKDATQETN